VLRKQIYLDEASDRRLRKLAAASGRSAASLIREAVGRYLQSRGGGTSDPLRPLIGAFSGGPRDAAAKHDKYLYGRKR
jgi:hypothetical protein